MRILIFSWRDIKHPLAGGAEQVMHEHAKGWKKAGHTVTHFSSRFPRSKSKDEIDGIFFVRSGYQYLGVQLMGFIYYIKNRQEFDLVVDEFHGIPFFTPFYVRKKRLAVVQETARKVWFFNPFAWPINWLIGAIGYLIEPLIFLFYKNTEFMTGSKSAKEDVIKMGIDCNNIAVVPHGVIVPDKFSLNKKEKKRTIIFLGKLSKDKGIEDAIRCFSILSSFGNFKFWIAGKSETKHYAERIDGLVKKTKLRGKLKFWGFVSDKKKFELLSRAHILINPSMREGWGLVNIEANSVGTPVIAYNSTGLVDSVNDGISGLICEENSPKEMAEKIIEVLKNESFYKRLSNGSKNWADKFSWLRSRNLSLKLLKNIH